MLILACFLCNVKLDAAGWRNAQCFLSAGMVHPMHIMHNDMAGPVALASHYIQSVNSWCTAVRFASLASRRSNKRCPVIERAYNALASRTEHGQEAGLRLETLRLRVVAII